MFSIFKQLKHARLLKKLEVDIVLYFGAARYIKSKVPYCLLVKPSEISEKPSRSFLKAVTSARSVLTFSEADKTLICQQFKMAPEKVGVVYAAAPENLKPINEDLHAAVKERYTGKCEYYIYTGSFADHVALVDLLKAFSFFKKRQKTAWKLVLINREPHTSAKFAEALKTYKYRDEVVVAGGGEDELESLLSSAYAFIYPAVQEDSGLYILEAMQFGLPVVAVQNKVIKEIAGEGAIYYNGSVNDLAEKMMALYKYEALRGQQMELVKEIVKSFSWQKTAEGIWEGVRKGIV